MAKFVISSFFHLLLMASNKCYWFMFGMFLFFLVLLLLLFQLYCALCWNMQHKINKICMIIKFKHIRYTLSLTPLSTSFHFLPNVTNSPFFTSLLSTHLVHEYNIYFIPLPLKYAPIWSCNFNLKFRNLFLGLVPKWNWKIPNFMDFVEFNCPPPFFAIFS